MTWQATFICGGRFVPASRFRVHPIETGLRSEGWATKLIHGYGAMDQMIANQTARRAYRAACRVRRAARTAMMHLDGPVMVQRLAWPWWAVPEVRLARNCGGLVFDFDDAVFLGEGGRQSAGRRKALSSVFAASRHVVAGNTWLAESIDANVPITVLPTCIDTSAYAPAKMRSERSLPVVGWIGTSSNFPYLHQLIDDVARLRAGGYKFDFRICSDVEPVSLVRELGATFVRWSDKGELSFLQSLDIGVMPLDDTDWCRGKCSFKLIQYMAVGCAVVASDVGFNRDVVSRDVGHLVRGGDWASPLADLLGSAEVRTRMGRAARLRAVERFDSTIALDTYRAILRGLQ